MKKKNITLFSTFAGCVPLVECKYLTLEFPVDYFNVNTQPILIGDKEIEIDTNIIKTAIANCIIGSFLDWRFPYVTDETTFELNKDDINLIIDLFNSITDKLEPIIEGHIAGHLNDVNAMYIREFNRNLNNYLTELKN